MHFHGASEDRCSYGPSWGGSRGTLSSRRDAWWGCLLLVGVSCSTPDRTRPAEQVSSAPAALNASPRLGDFAVFAQNGVRLQTSSRVIGGDVFARGTSGPFLSGGVAVDVLSSVNVDAARSLIADSVRLGTSATVGDIQTNRFTDGTSAKHGKVTAMVPLPPLPAAQPVSPGSQNVTVGSSKTVSLSPGAYAAVNVGTSGKLRLAAGRYDVSEVALGTSARLEALGAVEIHVGSRLRTGTSAFIGAAPGVTLTASKVRIDVLGVNGTTGSLGATPRAVELGGSNSVRALMLVPNGTLAVASSVVLRGAFAARDVDLGASAKITYEDGFPSCTPQSCDDANPCTADSCDGAACAHAPVADGAPCDDANACTRTDACAGGTCAGADPVVCSASDQCHDAGTCEPLTGACSGPPKPDGTPCNDENACTLVDACQQGACSGGFTVTCSATGPCRSAGTCSPASGECTDPAAPDGTACSDGDACTVSDVCAGGSCAGGTAVTCTAIDQCHDVGTCQPGTGACSTPPVVDGTACNDQSACTQGESCAAGACQGGTPVAVDDGNACTTDGCDPASGPTHVALVQHASCPEGFCLGTPPVCTPLAIHITSPQSLVTVGSFPVTVTGTVNSPAAIITVNGVAVPNVSGTFTASVALEEGHNTAVARAVLGDHQATDSISVSLDLTPPYVTIDSHVDGQTVYSDQVTVTGLINDIVRGTIEAQQAKVEVNGLAATISNRSYAARDVPLVPGDNAITVVGTDQVGNVGTAQLTLHYVVPTGRRIEVVSGQNQAAHIGTTLPAPLVVHVLGDSLAPAAGVPVAFRVIQGDGEVAAGTAGEARAVIVNTNAQGIASTTFKLGMRSGSANQKVRARVVGYDDEAIFYASAVGNPGNKISVNSGNNQRGAVGAVLPEPFVVVVTDEGSNVVQGARVRFDVSAGEGTLTGGAASYETETDSDGRATAEYVLGPVGGLDAQRITATLLDGPSGVLINAGFTASAFVPGDPGQTSISGVVLDNQDTPLPGVTVRVTGTTRQAVTTAQGQFKITEAPVGPVHLLVDPSTTTAAGEYPSLSYNIVTVAGVDNPLAAPIYMVKLNLANSIFAGRDDVALELADYPGFKLEIAKGSVTFPDGAKEGIVSVTAVNTSKVPMAPPNGMQPQFIVTIQPTGTRFDPPARISLPNVDSHPPGYQSELFSYDHDLEEFAPIGLGTVSEDGSVITSNAGVGVIKAGWTCGSPPSNQGCASGCPICQQAGSNCVCQLTTSDSRLASIDVPGDCRRPVCQIGPIQVPDDTDVPPPNDGCVECDGNGHVLTKPNGTECPDEGDPTCSVDRCQSGHCLHRTWASIAPVTPDPYPVDTASMTIGTQNAWLCLIDAVDRAGGTIVMDSGFRPQWYQDHLRDVWFHWEALKDWTEAECNEERENARWEQQQLPQPLPLSPGHRVGNEPNPSGGTHSQGIAFDAPFSLPASADIDVLANCCNLGRPCKNPGSCGFPVAHPDINHFVFTANSALPGCAP